MANREFKKRAIVGSLCFGFLLALPLIMALCPVPVHSRPSPGSYNGLGHKPHPQESGFQEVVLSKRSNPEASIVDAPGKKEFVGRKFPGLTPALSFGLILGFLIILGTGTVYRRAEL